MGGFPHPIPPWLGLSPRPCVSTVASSAYWVNKPVYITKNKSRDDLSEHLHFGGDRHIFVIFF